MNDLKDIVRRAQEEFAQEERRLVVDELKRRLLARKRNPWWKRLLPFTITFNWRKS